MIAINQKTINLITNELNNNSDGISIFGKLEEQDKQDINRGLKKLTSDERKDLFEKYIDKLKSNNSNNSSSFGYYKNEKGIQSAIIGKYAVIFDLDDICLIADCYKTVLSDDDNKDKNKGNYYPSSSINKYIEAIIAKFIGYSKKSENSTDDISANNSTYNNTNEIDNSAESQNIAGGKLLYKDKELPLQTIYYGSPGCGKSHEVKKLIEENKIDDDYQFRTTFHPDSDYYSFVGSYKPRKDTNGSITYGFSPQVFTKAYIQAWSNPQKAIVLVIEEINRGNCAQIFGDLFQLLDRDDNGYSEYPIDADEDLKQYLEEEFKHIEISVPENVEHLNNKKDTIKSGKLIVLPPNLYIIATMNTSDQSLFPMDSAFKRRWAWKYVPIDYTNAVSGGFKITIGGKDYGWHDFLEKINAKIYKVTNSEDKMLGNFFIKSSIGEEEFVDKIMFYLWNDVLKLEYASGNNSFFKYDSEKQKDESFTFNELFESDRTNILKGFMEKL